MKHTGTLSLLGVCVCILAFVLPGAAQADIKRYPGMNCKPSPASVISDFSINSPYIRNNSNFTRLVFCPIVRDNPSNANGTLANGTHVRVRNAVGTTSCSLHSTGFYGGIDFFDTVSTSVLGNVTLEVDLNNSTSPGFYNLYCRLSPGSLVWGYSINEYTTTD